jgi:hypothetical protein
MRLMPTSCKRPVKPKPSSQVVPEAIIVKTSASSSCRGPDEAFEAIIVKTSLCTGLLSTDFTKIGVKQLSWLE